MLQQLMHQQLLCAVIEKAINKALQLNLAGQQELNALSGKSLAISLSELAFTLELNVSEINPEQQLIVVTSDDKSAEPRCSCHIKTSLSTLRELKQEQQLTELIKQDKLDIHGDIKVAQQFARIAETLHIDWQSELAKHIGDVATHKLESLGKSLFSKVTNTGKQLSDDANEWLVHEKRLVVTEFEMKHLFTDIHQVSQQTTQLEQRLAQLAERIEQAQTSKIN